MQQPFWSCDQGLLNKLSFPRPKELSLIDPVVSDEEMFENVDERTTDGQTDDGVTGLQLAHL